MSKAAEPSCGDAHWDETFQGAARRVATERLRAPADGNGKDAPGATDAPDAPGVPSDLDTLFQLRLMSYNLLCPCYRTGNHGLNRSFDSPCETPAEWGARAARQIEEIVAAKPDVVGLQEFYHADPQFRAQWEAFADGHGYAMVVTPRTGGRPDGCCLLVRVGSGIKVTQVEAFGFSDYGNRVCQVVTATLPGNGGAMVTLINTHLNFPHENDHDPPMRFHQGRKLGQLAATRVDRGAVLCFGDMNGDPADAALVQLARLGQLQCMCSAPCDWGSHCSHLGAVMACDLIYSTPHVCVVRSWRHGGTEEALLAGTLPSDHRPLHAEIDIVISPRQL